MKLELFGIPDLDIYLIAGILLLFGLVEALAGFLKRTQRKAGDWLQEAGNLVILSTLTKPLIVMVVYWVGKSLFPGFSGQFGDASIWVGLMVFLPMDDFLQYWYHRLAHEYDWLWKLHRPHHQATEMGFFVSYRNAALYYLIMPNIWWTGLAAFAGFGEGVALGIVLKQVIIVGSHSTLKWDKPFYGSKILEPVIKVLQRVFITPAFHHAHHGVSKLDGISHPTGNFGNMFSIWDQLFGSAVFTDRYPADYGLQKQTSDRWTASVFYPLVKSKDTHSELAGGFRNQRTATNEPLLIEVKKGERMLWCACGRSQNQPFCDGSHNGTKFSPVVYEAKREGKVKLCNCKMSKLGPICDGSHLKVDASS